MSDESGHGTGIEARQPAKEQGSTGADWLSNPTRKLALQAATAEALELVLELKELKVNLSLELQAVRDQRQSEAREWRELAEAMRELIVSVKANERMNRTVLHLIGEEGEPSIGKTGELKHATRMSDSIPHRPLRATSIPLTSSSSASRSAIFSPSRGATL